MAAEQTGARQTGATRSVAPAPGCGGAMTATLSAGSIDPCGVVDVELVVEPPACTRCARLHVVFIQVGRARAAEWMIRESLAALDALRVAGTELDLDVRVGVVVYDTVTATVGLGMTDDFDAARTTLSVPVVGDAHGGFVERAARLAVGMLAEARALAAADGVGVCDTAVLFASTGPFNIAGGLLLRSAAGIVDDAGIPLSAGCPELSTLNCTFTSGLVDSARRYTEPPDAGKLAGVLRGDATDVASPVAIDAFQATVSQVLPTGLDFVEGSGAPPPAVSHVGGGTKLDWRWSAPPLGTYSATYRAAPSSAGRFAITGEARFELRDVPDVTLSMEPATIAVAGECAPTATAVGTDRPRTPEPTPTGTPEPTATAAPETPRPSPSASPWSNVFEISFPVVYSSE